MKQFVLSETTARSTRTPSEPVATDEVEIGWKPIDPKTGFDFGRVTIGQCNSSGTLKTE